MTAVLCLGDLMVDVLARLPGPLALGSDTPAPVSLLGGGSAANTAAWLASIGADVTFVGRVGDDAHGRAECVRLREAGVALAVGVDPQLPTGTCIVLVDASGERTMIPDAGANAALSAGDLPAAAFATGRHLHVSGYALFGAGRPAARHALDLARATGMTVSIGAASAGPLAAVGAEAFLGWAGTDVLLLSNRDEAAVLTGADDSEVAVAVLAARVGRAVVTCGRGGAVWCDGRAAVHVPAPDVDVVDSTGAGDAFAAGLLAALLDGAAPTDAMADGHRLAARACASPGARPAPDGHQEPR